MQIKDSRKNALVTGQQIVKWRAGGGQDKQNTSLQSCHITTNSKLFHARTGDWIFLRSFTMVSKYLQTRESDGKVEQLLLSIQRLSKSKSLWLYSRVVWAYNCLIVMLPNSGDTATPELAPGSSHNEWRHQVPAMLYILLDEIETKDMLPINCKYASLMLYLRSYKTLQSMLQ